MKGKHFVSQMNGASGIWIWDAPMGLMSLFT